MRWRRARRSSWPPPEIAELLELSGQLRGALLAVQGRHRPTLEDMALADRLAAHVLAERHGGRKQESGEQHVAINALPAG